MGDRLPRPNPGWLVALLGTAGALLAGWLAGSGAPRLGTLLALAGAGLTALLLKPDLLVFLGGFMFFAPTVFVAGIPGNEVGAALIVVAVLAQRSSRMVIPPALLVLGALFLAWAVVEQLINPMGEPGNRRLLHLLLWVCLALVFSSREAPRRMLAWGCLAGGALSLPLSLVTLGGYGGRFVGLVGDPNWYAAVTVVLVPLVIEQLRSTPLRWATWVGAGAIVLLAQSRTGIVAWTVALTIYVFLPLARRWILGVPIVAGTVLWISPADLRTQGGFAERAGSDLLRDRIQASAGDLIAQSPWTGHGLSTAKVNLGQFGRGKITEVFYFHNSYYGLIAEMGLVGAGIWVAIVIGALWRGLTRPFARGAIAGLCAGLVMGTQLGEVLLDLPVAVALGMAWAGGIRRSAETAQEPDEARLGASREIQEGRPIALVPRSG